MVSCRGPLDFKIAVMLSDFTACIEGFFEVEKGIENAIKSTNFISKF